MLFPYPESYPSLNSMSLLPLQKGDQKKKKIKRKNFKENAHIQKHKMKSHDVRLKDQEDTNKQNMR